MDDDELPVDDIEILEDDDSHDYIQPMKRRRSSSNSEHMKMLETVTRCIKDNNSKKLEMFQQAIQPQTELELYFASICKTVEKFQPMAQAKIKMEINQLIGRYEMEHFSNVIYTINTVDSSEYIMENYDDDDVEI